MVTQNGVVPPIVDIDRAVLQSIRGVPTNGDAKTWWVDALSGNNSNNGRTKDQPFLTMARAFQSVQSGDTIRFSGKIREQLVTPAQVFDVTIIGAGNRPRHADAAPAPLGGSSANTWTTPASGATTAALLRVIQQGWRFENILFAGPTDHACVELYRDAGAGDAERDSGHASFINCRFASGQEGISDTGGNVNVLVEDCRFEALTGFCILGVGNIGVGQSDWVIRNCRFDGFTNGVKIAAFGCHIYGNFFSDGGTPNTTVVLNTSNGGGSDNHIVRNSFQTATANFNTPDVVGNATDVWAENISIDSTAAGVGTNTEWGQPA